MNYHPHFYEMEMVSMIRHKPYQRLVMQPLIPYGHGGAVAAWLYILHV